MSGASSGAHDGSRVREALEARMRTILSRSGLPSNTVHLPLRTDCCCGEISRRAAEQTVCFVAPTLAFTYSGGELPGTINVSPHVVTQVVVEILHSLCRQGLHNIIIVLGHGGSENDHAAQEAAEIFLRNNPQYHDRNLAVVPLEELGAVRARLRRGRLSLRLVRDLIAALLGARPGAPRVRPR